MFAVLSQDANEGESIGHYKAIPNLVIVAVIFFFARSLNSTLKNLFVRRESGRVRTDFFDQETARATRRVLSIMLWIFAVIIAYPHIPGSQTDAFKGVSVFLGLMISLGSAGMVSQILGGLIVVYSRAFQPGEYIRLGEYEGTVVVVGVLSTKIRTIRNEEISIPNAVLLNTSTTNFSRLSSAEGLVISTSVTIGYDTPSSCSSARRNGATVFRQNLNHAFYKPRLVIGMSNTY